MAAKQAIKFGDFYWYDYTLYGKTLYANKDLTIYFSSLLRKKTGTIKKGEPIGTFQLFLPSDPSKNRQFPSLGFGVNTRSVNKFIKYEPDAINVAALRESGVQNVQQEVIQEQKEKDAEAEPWYTKLTKAGLPWIVTGLVAIFAINTYMKKQ